MSPTFFSAILLFMFCSLLGNLIGPANTNPIEWAIDNNGPHETYEDCGGPVPVTSTLDLIQFDGLVLGPSSCIWVLDSNYTTLEIYIDHITLPAGTELTVYYFPDSITTTFTVYRVPPNPQSRFTIPTPTRLVLLVLTSSGAILQSSFRLGFRGVSPHPGHAGYNIYKDSGSGQFTSGQYANNERSSIVIQPPPGTNLMTRVTEMDLENGRDYLHAYMLFILPGGDDYLAPVASFTGYHPFGPPDSTIDGTRPRVYILTSDNSIRGSGYGLEWR